LSESFVLVRVVAQSIVMSATTDLQSRPASGRGDFADKHAITQVEKWMAIIREISQERLSSDLSTSAEIDERTRVVLALTDQIIQANRAAREST